MPDLSARYMSLDLRNPVIIASSPLTADIANLRKCEEAGAGAVVLKSIFGEQIESQVDREMLQNEEYLSHADAALYFDKTEGTLQKAIAQVESMTMEERAAYAEKARQRILDDYRCEGVSANYEKLFEEISAAR